MEMYTQNSLSACKKMVLYTQNSLSGWRKMALYTQNSLSGWRKMAVSPEFPVRVEEDSSVPPEFPVRMRYIASYLLAVLGGNDNPTIADLKKILDSVGIELDKERADKTWNKRIQIDVKTLCLFQIIGELKGKKIDEVIAQAPPQLSAPVSEEQQSGEMLNDSQQLSARGAVRTEPSTIFNRLVLSAEDLGTDSASERCCIHLGNTKLASMPSGGAVAVASAGSAAPAASAAP
ncbi:hypothetical protein AB205_0216520, partial [Aquarana catesbeiana]